MKPFGNNSEAVADYFREKECPYSKRTPLKSARIYWVGGGLLVTFIGLTMWFGQEPGQGKDKKGASAKDESTTRAGLAQTPQPGSIERRTGTGNQKGAFSSTALLGARLKTTGALSNAVGGRSHSANQVIRRGQNGNDPLTRIPLGSTFVARLVNSIVSTDSGTPVIATIPDDVLAHNTPSIPAGTQAIGQATFEEGSKRIQVHFNTLVYPDGDQHGLQGVAMMGDGSAGLIGDYHSEGVRRELGNFFGNFISGFAAGMTDRTASGGMGIPYDVGSVKNGVLNGVALSAQSETKSFSEDLSKTKPYMTLPSGTQFLIFLEREYLP